MRPLRGPLWGQGGRPVPHSPTHQLHTFQPGPGPPHPYPPPGLLGEGGAETLSQGREGPPQGAGHRAGGHPTALGLDKVMRDALANVPPVRPGASSRALPAHPRKPVRCGHRVLPPPCPAHLPVLLLLLLLCLVRWLSARALPSQASAFSSLGSGGERGEAELKHLGPESWGLSGALL